MEQQAIITVKDLRTYFYSDKRCNKVLNGVSFELYKGRTLCGGGVGLRQERDGLFHHAASAKLSRIESGAITTTARRVTFGSINCPATARKCAPSAAGT